MKLETKIYRHLKNNLDSLNDGQKKALARELMEIIESSTIELPVLRRAVADYMRSEGCSCCSDIEEHKKHKKRLANLLNVPEYENGPGYNFSRYESET